MVVGIVAKQSAQHFFGVVRLSLFTEQDRVGHLQAAIFFVLLQRFLRLGDRAIDFMALAIGVDQKHLRAPRFFGAQFCEFLVAVFGGRVIFLLAVYAPELFIQNREVAGIFGVLGLSCNSGNGVG